MLTTANRVVQLVLVAALLAVGTMVVALGATSTEAVAHARGPDHVCVVDPSSAECTRWRDEHGDGADSGEPVYPPGCGSAHL